MEKRRIIGIVMVTVLLSGCATILGGTTQILTVNSNVKGAEVRLNNTILGTTPLTAIVKRGQSGVLQVSAPGYQPYQIALNKSISSLFWVNILTGGVWGSSTDYSTGAMYEYEPSTFMASLEPASLSMMERRKWERREGLRSFVLQNGQALSADLAIGHGEYIDVLAYALAVPGNERDAAVVRWQSMYAESTTAAQFAQQIVSELDRSN